MLDKLTNTQKWILGIVAIVSTIGGISWGMAVWVTSTNAKGVKTDNLEIKMGGMQKAFENQKRSQDSLKTVIVDYVTKTDKLQNSYVLYVQEHSKDLEEFTHSLQGLTFELVQPEKSVEKSSVKPSAIIRVVPVKPIKK
jgi:hypothetical protein